MTKLSKIIYFFLCTVFLILFNQQLTNYILGFSNFDNELLEIVFVQNSGAAFNILQGSKQFLIIFSVLAMAIIIFNTVKYIQKIHSISLFFTSLLMSGIFCNMYERISFGFVRDFIKLKFIDFPVFNVSDIFINVGVFVLVVIIVKNSYIKNNEIDN